MKTIAQNQSVSYELTDHYLLRSFTGSISMNTIIDSWMLILSEYYTHFKRFVIISDYRDADLNVKLDDNIHMQKLRQARRKKIL